MFTSKSSTDGRDDKNIEHIKAPVDEHCAIYLIEPTISVIRNGFACYENGADLKLEASVEELTYHLRNTDVRQNLDFRHGSLDFRQGGLDFQQIGLDFLQGDLDFKPDRKITKSSPAAAQKTAANF